MLILIIILCLCVLSCQHTPEPFEIRESFETRTSLHDAKAQTDAEIPVPRVDYFEEENVLEVEFDNFILSFPGVQLLREIKGENWGTLEAILDIMYDLNNQEVRFEIRDRAEEYANIKRCESYHTVLYQWKTFDSGWLPLREENFGFFTKEISEKESRKFPEFSREELSLAAERYGDKGWKELIENSTFDDWKEQFWIGVGIRRLKIDLCRESEKSTWIIKFYIPMGC